jgi:hypothetical protein
MIISIQTITDAISQYRPSDLKELSMHMKKQMSGFVGRDRILGEVQFNSPLFSETSWMDVVIFSDKLQLEIITLKKNLHLCKQHI